MKMNKSLITNILAMIVFGVSFFAPLPLAKYLFKAASYALSGAITNWLAIYMLFEKVPYLYGSGIIELNFARFKASIKEMMMEQFFNHQNIKNFLDTEEMKIDLGGVVANADMNKAFDALKSAIMESKFGGMIGMFGGESVLESFREPFLEKLRSSLVSIVRSNEFHEELRAHINSQSLQYDLVSWVDVIVTNRLNELTPKMVKELIKTLISEHLGWLVVWGGVFGGVVGVVAAIVE